MRAGTLHALARFPLLLFVLACCLQLHAWVRVRCEGADDDASHVYVVMRSWQALDAARAWMTP